MTNCINALKSRLKLSFVKKINHNIKNNMTND
jgi:hypothetical protein